MDAKRTAFGLDLLRHGNLTGDDRGTVYDRHRLGRDQQHGYERTVNLPSHCRISTDNRLVHIYQPYLLVLHESACYEWRDTICALSL